VAALPLVLLFILLGVFKAPAWISSLSALVLCVILSIVGWQMPFGQSMSATLLGIFNGLFQIMWLLVAALWLYNTTVKLGWDRVLRDLMRGISDDLRVLSILIAFSFGALIEGLAGFGTPVAITAGIMAATGMPKLKAAAVCMLANTAPVAFGSVGAPITALGTAAAAKFGDGASYAIGSVDPTVLSTTFGAMIGRQSPFMAIIVPFFLLFMVDGIRGVKDCWHIALVGGVSFALVQFLASNYVSYMITDILASLFSLLVLILFLRAVQPKNKMAAEVVQDEGELLPSQKTTGAARVWGALAPYLVIVVLFSVSKIPVIASWLSSTLTPHSVNAATGKSQAGFIWPGLADCHGPAAADGSVGGACVSATVNLYSVLSSGFILAIGALITAAIYKLAIGKSFKVLGATIVSLRYTIITIGCVLGIAYIMNASGITLSLGMALAGVGAAFVAVSPVLGWLGVALTGSDTSSNALFGSMQVAAAQGVWPGSIPHQVLAASTNSSGGVMGKMISPQSLSVAAAAAGLLNKEGEIFRKVLPWSIVLLVIFAALVTLQGTVLTGMIPVPPVP